MRRVFIAGIILAAGATGPRAQTVPGEVFNPYHLNDTIVVTANRVATPSRQVASSITVITGKQIEQAGSFTVAELLRTVPGLDVVRSGGQGQQTSIFLRGANSEHVLVIIDGVEINDPASPNNAVNLASLGTDNIDRIEILRGPQSVLYGSDAVGGVIQIFTRRGLSKPEVQLSAEAGSLDTYREEVSLNAGRRDLDYSLALSRRDTRGISAASGIRNLEPDGFGNTSASAGFALRPSSRVQVRLSGRISTSDTELDQGGGILDDPNYTMHSKDGNLSARLEHDIKPGRWWQQFGAYVTKYERSTLDGVDAAHPSDTNETNYDGRRIKLDWQSAVALGAPGRVTMGIETEEDRLSQALFFGSAWGAYNSRIEGVRARTSGVFALGEWSFRDRLHGTAGWRYDRHDAFGAHATYRVTAAWLENKLGLKVKASLGTGFKAPALFQIFDPATGNPRLEPERSRGGEIGWEIGSLGHQVSFGQTFFYTKFTNLILFGSTTGRMTNTAEARVLGVEHAMTFDIGGISCRAGYTYTDAIDRQSQLPLVRRPRHKATLQLSGQMTKSLYTMGELVYTGARQDIDYSVWPPERVKLHDFAVVNAVAQYQIATGVHFSARIENLLDADYEEVLDFSSVPLSATVGIELTY